MNILKYDLAMDGNTVRFYELCGHDFVIFAHFVELSTQTCQCRAGTGTHMDIAFLTPLNAWRNNNVVITSKRRHFDVITSKWRRFDVITTSLLRNVSTGTVRESSSHKLISLTKEPMVRRFDVLILLLWTSYVTYCRVAGDLIRYDAHLTSL